MLHGLSQPEFDISFLSGRIFTAKTIFLPALASTGRLSAMAALSFKEMNLSADKVYIGYDIYFVPNSYFVKKNITCI